MKKYYDKIHHLQILLLCIFAYTSFYFKEKITKPEQEFNPDDSALNFQPKLIMLTSFGNKRLISSLLWTHTLLFSDTIHFNNSKPGFSWLYYRFNNISELEPYFYNNYLWGGMYLSVIKDDDLGAESFLLRSLDIFKEDKDLNFYLGMHYQFELKNYKNALHFFKIAFKQHHPYKSLPALIFKLELNSQSIAKDSYLLPFEAYQKEKNIDFRTRYYDIAYKSKSEYDLNCLQSKMKDCSKTDLDGKPYIMIKGNWTASRKF
jgi:hypothetical protein